MHTNRPPILAASLLAIITLSPLLVADFLNAADTNDESNEQSQITRSHQDNQDQNFPSQQFIESRSSMQEHPRQLFRLHILDSRPRMISRNKNGLHSTPNNDNSTTIRTTTDAKTNKKLNKINISNATLKKLLSQAMQQQQNRLAIISRNNLTSSSSAAAATTTTSSTTNRPTIDSLSSDINNSEQANFIIHNANGHSSPLTTSTTAKFDPDDFSSNGKLVYKPSFATRSPSLKPGGSNFKFVFIQRAAANNNNSTGQNHSVKHKKQTDAIGQQSTATTTTTTVAPSLAASISKQLASSLLYSAANFVNNLNLTSQLNQPSLSELKNQLSMNFGTRTKEDDENTERTDTTSNDIRRLTTVSIKSEDSLTTKSPHQSTFSTSQKPKYRKNSKIYNLPVKFVANGQPNGQVVIQTIRQHLAAMKRTNSVSVTTPDYGIVKHANNNYNNINKQNNNNDQSTKNKNKQIKLKGVNSRLIYLPLRMLMNGKPSRISVLAGKIAQDDTKSTIKSTTITTTTAKPNTETESQ